MQDVRYGFRAPRDNLSQQAYDFLMTHPDTRIYFPAYPLAHLMAEQKLYHFMLAIRDREVEAGVPLSPEQFQAHVPPAPEYVAWSKRLYKTERLIMPGYYAEYVQPQRIDGLPDFRCFSR